jgi:hypothetical protein
MEYTTMAKSNSKGRKAVRGARPDIKVAGVHNPAADTLTGVAACIVDVMDQLLIFAAALRASNCEVARAVGYRLDDVNLCNDLDVQREIIVAVASDIEQSKGAGGAS